MATGGTTSPELDKQDQAADLKSETTAFFSQVGQTMSSVSAIDASNKLPTFSGEISHRSFTRWLQQVEQAARFGSWTDFTTAQAALYRLEGTAGEWGLSLEYENPRAIESWKILKPLMKDRFGDDKGAMHGVDGLVNLKQRLDPYETVDQFRDRCVCAVRQYMSFDRPIDLDPKEPNLYDQATNFVTQGLFLAGLSTPVRQKVIANGQMVKDMSSLRQTAKAAERALAENMERPLVDVQAWGFSRGRPNNRGRLYGGRFQANRNMGLSRNAPPPRANDGNKGRGRPNANNNRRVQRWCAFCQKTGNHSTDYCWHKNNARVYAINASEEEDLAQKVGNLQLDPNEH